VNPRRVLLTGANGQVGRACRLAAPAGIELRALTRAELDIGDESAVNACVDGFRPDLLINAAAFTAVDKAESERDAAFRGNAQAPRRLAAAIARLPQARMVHVSTDFVFDGRASTPYAPDAATVPLSVYGASKLAGEQAVRETLGERATIVRTAWLYSSTGANFVRTMLRLMSAGPVRVIADQVGTPTSAASLAGLLWRVAAERAGGVFHFTDAGVASWYDFAVAIGEEAHACALLPAPAQVTPIKTSEYPTPATRPAYSVLDISETLRRFGLPPVHWRSRLRTVIGELRNA
jgi:dTDP-4-dehydrorhamnose reductase